MTYEEFIPELEPIIDGVVYKFRNAKTEKRGLATGSAPCVDQMSGQAASGAGRRI